MKVLAIIFILLTVLSTMVSFTLVGKERKPLTQEAAAIGAMLNVLLISLLIQVVVA